MDGNTLMFLKLEWEDKALPGETRGPFSEAVPLLRPEIRRNRLVLDAGLTGKVRSGRPPLGRFGRNVLTGPHRSLTLIRLPEVSPVGAERKSSLIPGPVSFRYGFRFAFRILLKLLNWCLFLDKSGCLRPFSGEGGSFSGSEGEGVDGGHGPVPDHLRPG